MPSVFLSPSSQEFNPYVDGGNEEYYMNIIADAVIPYLEAAGIAYGRNTTGGTFLDSVRLSNEGTYDLHLAIHSNASAPANKGQAKGTQVYYYPQSAKGTRAANTFANHFREIYPDPDKVKTVPTTTLGEIVKTKAPAILIEVAYHDNPEDAQWIRDNIESIAENLAVSIGDFLGVPIVPPQTESFGTVSTRGGSLNLRSQPTTNAQVIGRIPNGAAIPLLRKEKDWYLTEYEQTRGYVSERYVTPEGSS